MYLDGEESSRRAESKEPCLSLELDLKMCWWQLRSCGGGRFVLTQATCDRGGPGPGCVCLREEVEVRRPEVCSQVGRWVPSQADLLGPVKDERI